MSELADCLFMLVVFYWGQNNIKKYLFNITDKLINKRIVNTFLSNNIKI